MPREIVAVGPQSFGIEVVWRRGSFAQIGIRTREGEKLVDIVKDASDGEDFDSLWADLDLEQIDNLMKVLRRVRKQLVMAPNPDADEAYKPILT